MFNEIIQGLIGFTNNQNLFIFSVDTKELLCCSKLNVNIVRQIIYSENFRAIIIITNQTSIIILTIEEKFHNLELNYGGRLNGHCD